MSNLKRNIAYNFIYQVLILLLPLITAPYLARVIGASGVGSYSYSYTMATYFTYFVKLGLDNYGNRAIASVQSDRAERSRRFCSIYALQISCFFIASVAYAIYIAVFSRDKTLAAIQAIYLISSLFDINWFFFGMEKFSMTVVRNTLIKIATTVSIFIFVKDGNDVWAYTVIMCVGFLASQLALWPFVPKFVDFVKPHCSDVLQHLKPNAVLFVSVIAISVYNMMSRLMLGAMSGMEQVGYFENAAKLISVPTALINAVGTVMLPRTSYLLSNDGKDSALRYMDNSMRGVMSFSFLALFGLTAISDNFVMWFYGPGYEDTAAVLRVLAATVPILGFGNVIRTQYLIPSGKDKVFLMSAVCGAITSIVVNTLLIPMYGCVGSAMASVAAETAVLVCQVVGVGKSISVGRYIGIVLRYSICGLIMFLLLEYTNMIREGFIGLLSTVVIGLAIYGAAVVVGLIAARAVRRIKEKVD